MNYLIAILWCMVMCIQTIYTQPTSDNNITVISAGSDNVIVDVMTNIFNAYTFSNPTVQFTNTTTGKSSITYAASGINQQGVFTVQPYTLQFGMSGLALTQSQVQSTPDILAVPLIAFAVAPIYNIPNVGQLVLNRITLAQIFSGDITNWNDTRLQLLQSSGTTLPDLNITVYWKSASGTNYVWITAMNKFCSACGYPVATTFGNPAGM